jgi:hypothetical protein
LNDFILHIRIDFPQFLYQSAFIHASDLIQNDLTPFSVKLAVNPSWVISALRRHWGYYDSGNVAIHFIG